MFDMRQGGIALKDGLCVLEPQQGRLLVLRVGLSHERAHSCAVGSGRHLATLS